MTIEAGSVVVAQLSSPREQVFGLLQRLDATGLVIRGLSLSSVDDWMREVAGDEPPSLGLATTFYPMHRVEKVHLDEPSGPVPSIEQRLFQRTGRTLAEHVNEADVPATS